MNKNKSEGGALPIINLLVSVIFVLASGVAGQLASTPKQDNPAVGLGALTNSDFRPPVELILPNAPDHVKSVYLTGGSSGRQKYIDYVIELAKTSQINAVVVDIKDYTGYVLYRTSDLIAPLVKEYGARKIAIGDIDGMIKKFHDAGIYVIARIVVFQDTVLAEARPDLAILKKYEPINSLSFPGFWTDRAGLMWVDPASEEVWSYNIAIAKDAISHGFDEINFDYIRFPSDGDLKNISYPFWDRETTTRHSAIKGFFKKLREELPSAKLSVDLFGLTTINRDDLGVGQIIEDAFLYFDYVCPMVYPSHYAKGFLMYDNPADYPYEVVNYSMVRAMEKLRVFRLNNSGSTRNVYLRPWLQDFNLKAEYNADMVKLEIKGTLDALGADDFKGFMLWNASNIYTEEAVE